MISPWKYIQEKHLALSVKADVENPLLQNAYSD